MNLMSAPAANALSPAPVTTIAPIAGSASYASAASPSSPTSVGESALSALGRLRVMTPTLPRVSVKIVSYVAAADDTDDISGLVALGRAAAGADDPRPDPQRLASFVETLQPPFLLSRPPARRAALAALLTGWRLEARSRLLEALAPSLGAWSRARQIDLAGGAHEAAALVLESLEVLLDGGGLDWRAAGEVRLSPAGRQRCEALCELAPQTPNLKKQLDRRRNAVKTFQAASSPFGDWHHAGHGG